LISTVKYGFLFQGQRSRWQSHRRGAPAYGQRPEQFINYLQNHDQVANQGLGLRLHRITSPGRYRAITAFLLLSPGTPMLFQARNLPHPRRSCSCRSPWRIGPMAGGAGRSLLQLCP
jgi:maltooligosyltrehalose trehalohydrolase